MIRTMLLALAGATALSAAPAYADGVKIGFIATFSGPGGVLGQDLYDGFMLGVENSGGKLGGVATEVIKEDDQSKPDVGLQAAQKLLQRDKVDLLTGIVFSNVFVAVQKPAVESETFLIGSNAAPSIYAGEQCSPYVFSTSWQNDQNHAAMGAVLQKKGVKKVYLMAPNYQAGKDGLTGFKSSYKGEVVDEVYTTFNQTDYQAEITQLRAAKPEATYVFYPGGMGINFVKQYAQAGLTKSTPLYSAFTVDATTVPAQGDAALGTFGTASWTYDLDNPANKKFVADFEKKYGRVPSTYAAQSYDSALLIDAALKKTGGKVTADKTAFRDALRKADFASVRGGFKFNTNHYPVQNFYLFETVKDDKGRLVQAKRETVFENAGDAYAAKCAMKW